MTIVVYTSQSTNSVGVVIKDSDNIQRLESDAKFIHEINGDSWDDCMSQYYEYMGWEAYRSFDL